MAINKEKQIDTLKKNLEEERNHLAEFEIQLHNSNTPQQVRDYLPQKIEETENQIKKCMKEIVHLKAA